MATLCKLPERKLASQPMHEKVKDKANIASNMKFIPDIHELLLSTNWPLSYSQKAGDNQGPLIRLPIQP